MASRTVSSEWDRSSDVVRYVRIGIDGTFVRFFVVALVFIGQILDLRRRIGPDVDFDSDSGRGLCRLLYGIFRRFDHRTAGKFFALCTLHFFWIALYTRYIAHFTIYTSQFITYTLQKLTHYSLHFFCIFSGIIRFLASDALRILDALDRIFDRGSTRSVHLSIRRRSENLVQLDSLAGGCVSFFFFLNIRLTNCFFFQLLRFGLGQLRFDSAVRSIIDAFVVSDRRYSPTEILSLGVHAIDQFVEDES